MNNTEMQLLGSKFFLLVRIFSGYLDLVISFAKFVALERAVLMACRMKINFIKVQKEFTLRSCTWLLLWSLRKRHA